MSIRCSAPLVLRATTDFVLCVFYGVCVSVCVIESGPLGEREGKGGVGKRGCGREEKCRRDRVGEKSRRDIENVKEK